jgi:hypothetical protein
MIVNDSSDSAALASKVDDFIQRFDALMQAWVPVPNDGGAKLKADYLVEFVTPPAVTPQLTGSTNLKVDS